MSSVSRPRVALVAHDNYGSREIFSKIISENRNVDFTLFISTGLYYKKSFFSSVVKLLKEASFWFCLMRLLEGLLYKFKGDTLHKRALKAKVPIFFTDDINSSESHARLIERKVDLLVSMFTMQILNQKTIDLPRLGTIGTHPSVLPEYRGLEVFFWMLANEEKKAGVSVFYLASKIDAGKVFLQEPFLIHERESVDSIYKKLTLISARLLAEGISKILSQEPLTYLPYEGKGSYYPMPTRECFQKFMRTKHTWFGEPEKEKKL